MPNRKGIRKGYCTSDKTVEYSTTDETLELVKNTCLIISSYF